MLEVPITYAKFPDCGVTSKLLKRFSMRKMGCGVLSCECRGSVAGTVDIEHGSSTHDDIHTGFSAIGRQSSSAVYLGVPRVSLGSRCETLMTA